jgi:L-amino acid N-acyltransferase YncA
MPDGEVTVRPARDSDRDQIWEILQPTIEAGETYPLDRGMTREAALGYWFGRPHDVFVAETADEVIGTYFLQPNQQGAGSHVANCGYMTRPSVRRRGVGAAMCADSLARAKACGFLAMQFNFVVSSNESAVRLWQAHGFAIVGRVPQAFRHPSLGLVDTLVMHRFLD